MSEDNKIGLESIWDNTDFLAGMNEYMNSMDDASKQTEESGASMSDTFDKLADVGEVVFTGLAAGAVAGIGAMSAEFYTAVEAGKEVEDTYMKLGIILDNVGEKTGVTVEQVDGLAASLSQVAPFDDEVIVQAQTAALKFEGITKDNLPRLLKVSADMAIMTGKSLPGSMTLLARSMASPTKATRALMQAGIILNASEREQLKTWEKNGDTLKAQDFLFGKLEDRFKGASEAAGNTLSGKMKILETSIGNLHEALGQYLLPALEKFYTKLNELANNPEIMKAFGDIGKAVGDFAMNVVSNLPDVIKLFKDFANFVMENKPLVIGVVSALGVALLAFFASASAAAISAGISIIVAWGPIVLLLAAIGTAAYLLYRAWTENWGGIATTLTAYWNSTILPIVQEVQVWLGENIPIAMAYLSNLWYTVLLPAVSAIVNWLGTNLPIAVAFLSKLWTGTLLPAFKAFFEWVGKVAGPVLEELGRFFREVIPPAVQTLVVVWNTALLPALQAMWSIISTYALPVLGALILIIKNVAEILAKLFIANLQITSKYITQNFLPGIRALSTFFGESLLPIIKTVAGYFAGAFKGALDLVASAFAYVNEKIDYVIGKFKELGQVIPEWLKPGSPPPLEIGLQGINEQLKLMANTQLPAVRYQLQVMATTQAVGTFGARSVLGQNISSSQSTHNYMYGPQFNVNSNQSMLEILSGLQ